MPQDPRPLTDADRLAALASFPVDRAAQYAPAPVPPDTALYVEGWKAGLALGYAEGRASGYMDAKLRSRFALEAAADAALLSRAQRDELTRAQDAAVGTVR